MGETTLPRLQDIKRRRNALGMTQRRLARLAGCSQSHLAKIEGGKLAPNYQMAMRIFTILDSSERRGEKQVREVMHSPVITFDSSDRVADAVRVAKEKDIDQFPILRRGRVVGSVTTVQLMGVRSHIKLGDVMGATLPTVPSATPVASIRQLLQVSPAVLVVEGEEIRGIVSPQDLL